MSVKGHSAYLTLFPINCTCGQGAGSSASGEEVGSLGSQQIPGRHKDPRVLQLCPWIYESSAADRFYVALGPCPRKFDVSSCTFSHELQPCTYMLSHKVKKLSPSHLFLSWKLVAGDPATPNLHTAFSHATKMPFSYCGRE